MGSGSSKKTNVANQGQQIAKSSGLKIDLSKLSRSKTRQSPFPPAYDSIQDHSSIQQKSSRINGFVNEDKKEHRNNEAAQKIQKNKLKSQTQFFDSYHIHNNYRNREESEMHVDEDHSPIQRQINKDYNMKRQFSPSKTIGVSENINNGLKTFHISRLKGQEKKMSLPNQKFTQIQRQSQKQTRSEITPSQNQPQSTQKHQFQLSAQLEFQTSKQIEEKQTNYNQYSRSIMKGSIFGDNKEDGDDEDDDEDEGESQYLSLSSSEEEKRRENKRVKQIQKKQKQKQQMQNINSQQKLSRKRLIINDTIEIDSYYSEEDNMKISGQKEKFFIESLNQMGMLNDQQTLNCKDYSLIFAQQIFIQHLLL